MATQHESFRRGSLSSLSSVSRGSCGSTQLRTAAVAAAKYQLLPPPTVTTRPAAADSTTCKTAFRLQRLALQCPSRRRSADLAFSLSSELSCRGCRPQLHILVLSRNPFSRLGCHPHIKPPTSGPHWAIMGIVVFWGGFGLFGTQSQQGAIFCCAVTFAGCLTCSSSGGPTATAGHVL